LSSWWTDSVKILGSSRHITAVPFPWCTSRSTMRTLETSPSSRSTLLATGTSFSRQKPSP
jgi:hypothetical protein